MKALLSREVKLMTRDGGALMQLWLLPILILFVAGLFLPTDGIRPHTLTVVMLFALLMVTLPLTARLWHDDVNSGVAEHILLARGSLVALTSARLGSLFFAVYLPVCVLIVLGMQVWLGYVPTVTGFIALLLLALPTLSLALLVAALTVSVRNGGLLVALLLIPFLLPLFVAFAALPQIPAALNLLAAGAVLAAPLCVLATASVLRQQLSV